MVHKINSGLQALKSEIDKLKEQEVELRGLIVQAAERGAAETAEQFRGDPPNDSDLHAADLAEQLEILQGVRGFAQGLVVRFKSPKANMTLHSLSQLLLCKSRSQTYLER